MLMKLKQKKIKTTRDKKINSNIYIFVGGEVTGYRKQGR